MKNTVSVQADIGGKTLRIESGVLARQAAGSAVVTLGDTMVFSAVTVGRKNRDEIDYFPLQVEYREKYYAAGRFPGGYIKREARPSEKEILSARLTDRPLRPLFPDSFRKDVQINNMLMSYDDLYDSDVLSIVAGSTAVVLSGLPFAGPVGAVRVARIDGNLVVNPSNEERLKSDLDLVYAALRDMPLMIEGSAREISESDIVGAMKIAHAEAVKIIDLQLELRSKMGIAAGPGADDAGDTKVLDAAREAGAAKLAAILRTADRAERSAKKSEFFDALYKELLVKFPGLSEPEFNQVSDSLEIEQVRDFILKNGRRLDGRGFDDLRQLTGEVGIIPRTHGSSLFSRGETQAMAVVTLGSQEDSQRLDAIAGGATEKKFMLHYNFPPYCTGEAGRLGSTSRREIGHGALAERSLREVMPAEFPYTVRLVSEIMGSNGSSSMASACAGTLALMDAGVPIRKPVAGIAIGLVTGNGQAHILTDIAGEEDHCGDMDFKVAGTRDGITGFQVDLKIRGLEWRLVEEAFEKARAARIKVLDFMSTIIGEVRPNMSPYAPRITTVRINPEDIGALIGPGGKNIRRITDLTGTQIDIEDDGTVNIFAKNEEAMKMALAEVQAISAEIEEGVTYEGKVVDIKPFGAFVQVMPGKDGLVHISELADFRVKTVEDICKVGDTMTVKCIGIDERGRVRLSRRAAMQEKDGGGGAAAPEPPPLPADAGPRGRNDRRHHRSNDR